MTTLPAILIGALDREFLGSLRSDSVLGKSRPNSDLLLARPFSSFTGRREKEEEDEEEEGEGGVPGCFFLFDVNDDSDDR